MPMPLADGVLVAVAPAPAEHFDLAGGRLQQSFEDLDGGGLAGAVGAEQAEALAGLDGQIESANRLDGRAARVVLDELGAADG